MAMATSMTPSIDAGGGNVCVPPSSQACSFELDVQWIIDIIDQVEEFLRTAGAVANEVFQVIGGLLEAIATVVDWFVNLTGIGKWAKDNIREACNAAGEAAERLSNLGADLVAFTANALAPWEIRSAGRQINAQIVPQAGDFTESLDPGNFASTQTWKGTSADRFLANLARQKEFADTLQTNTADFGGTVERMGDEGVEATITFVREFGEAAESLINAAISLYKMPVGTIGFAIEVYNLIESITAMVRIWMETMDAVMSQTNQLTSAANRAAPSGQWPAIAN